MELRQLTTDYERRTFGECLSRARATRGIAFREKPRSRFGMAHLAFGNAYAIFENHRDAAARMVAGFIVHDLVTISAELPQAGRERSAAGFRDRGERPLVAVQWRRSNRGWRRRCCRGNPAGEGNHRVPARRSCGSDDAVHAIQIRQGRRAVKSPLQRDVRGRRHVGATHDSAGREARSVRPLGVRFSAPGWKRPPDVAF